MRILLLDIECAPNLVHVWGLWQQNVGLPQIIDSGYVLCWAAKWLGQDEIYYDSVYESKPRHMLKGIHQLLDEADAVIHYNGTRFDIPTLNKEFLINGFTPPAPYKQIDLLRVARNQFKFASNKLNYIAPMLGLGKKTEHIGHELWVRCMSNDPEAWAVMKEYNIQDIALLEGVYNKLKPWIKNHANYSVYTDGVGVCPNCGSDDYNKRGFYYTNNRKYQRHRCNKCGTWFRNSISIKQDGDKYLYAG